MNELNLSFAFTAGMLATVNPCSWAMLTSFVSYYLGSREEGFEDKPLASRIREGLILGLLVTAGILAVLGTAGIGISAGLRVIGKWMPLASLLVGAGLVLLGLYLLTGKSLPLSLPTPQIDLQSRNPKSVLLFGVAYAFASLSCTLPVFLVVVGTSLTAAGLAGSATMFMSYAAGIAVVLMSSAVGAALLKGSVAKWFRGLLPYVHRIGAVLLVLAGVYLIWYQGRNLPLILTGF